MKLLGSEERAFSIKIHSRCISWEQTRTKGKHISLYCEWQSGIIGSTLRRLEHTVSIGDYYRDML